MQPSRAFRAANVAMALLFVFGAAVQYNDPDPLRWVTMYLVAAACCALWATGRRAWWLPALVTVVALVWAATWHPQVVARVPVLSMFAAWEMKNEAIEEARETWGLVLIGGWMVVLTVEAFLAPPGGGHRLTDGLDCPRKGTVGVVRSKRQLVQP